MTDGSGNQAWRLDAHGAAAAIRAGTMTSEHLIRACLERISEREETVGAWAFIDPDYALEQARARDRQQPLGPLHGIPVGLKDIFDTADMPTENGALLHAGRRPETDAGATEILRAAGAVIMGKTVTAEFAVSHPGKTANPHDPRRTPGGSSSGSAAAVADFMVPLALGTQTTGSVIHPASYCGILGYKPTFGSITRHGIHINAHRQDHVGMFARSLEDMALIADVLMVLDRRDRDMRRLPGLNLAAALAGKQDTAPRLAFVKGPVWDLAGEDARTACDQLMKKLGGAVEEIDLPPAFDNAVAWHTLIFEVNQAATFGGLTEEEAGKLSADLRGRIAKGASVAGAEYVRAVRNADALDGALEDIFSRFDALLTTAAPSAAPLGLHSTGNANLNAIWSLCGTPVLSLPVMKGEGGMPLGAQIIGRKGEDARLFRTARWLEQNI